MVMDTTTSQAQPVVTKVPVSSDAPRQIHVRPVSPIEYFRELLAMSPAERERALQEKKPEQRNSLLAKISEYEAMSADERELRLRMTQLRWQLVPLMKVPPIERIKTLASIPSEDRALLERRLKIWDEIPVHLQKEFLENEALIGYVLRWESSTPQEKEKLLSAFPPERRAKLEQQLASWQALPLERRQQHCSQFTEFFELDDKEKEKTLRTLSAADREQMEKTLERFNKLPPEQRKRCLDSFTKFTGMSTEQRSQFLKNAERWETMTPSEREVWRKLVMKSTPQPPLPPGIRPLPPSPPRSAVASTNASK